MQPVLVVLQTRVQRKEETYVSLNLLPLKRQGGVGRGCIIYDAASAVVFNIELWLHVTVNNISIK